MTETITPERTEPPILASLPEPAILTRGCPGRRRQIDLLLLAIESLELSGTERLLAAIERLELTEVIDSRVTLWRLRGSNPWRRSRSRRPLELVQMKALVLLVAYRSRQLTVLTRQLLLAREQLEARQIPLERHFRLSEYLERFRAHFRGRMNPRRARVAEYLASREKLDALALSLLSQLLFCTGTAGTRRLWSSLFDGEVQ